MIDAKSQLKFLEDNFLELASTCKPLWHPLGFVSCIIRKEKYFTSRIHYWPKMERRTKVPNWPIHTHVYDLSSYILAGRVRDIQYRKKDGTDYVIYSVSYKGEDSEIKSTSTYTSIRKISDRIRSIGDEYAIPLGVFHETQVPLDEFAITLVALSNFADSAPLVLGEKEIGIHSYDREEFDRLEFWRRIEPAAWANLK